MQCINPRFERQSSGKGLGFLIVAKTTARDKSVSDEKKFKLFVSLSLQMSNQQPEDVHMEQDNGFKEEYIEADQIGEVVPEGEENEPMSEDDDDQADEGVERIEIDMSNNSSSYFDSHTDSIYLINSHHALPMVVTGGGDNMGYLWTTHSNPARLVTQLTGHNESVIAGGFTSNGEFLVTGDMTGQIRVWKSLSKGSKWQFYASVQEVEEIVWIKCHPNQNIFAVGASDGTVWCYALEPNLENIAVLSSHSLPTNGGVFVGTQDVDNLSLISISDDATIVGWNVYMQTANYTLTPPQLHGEHPWVSLAISPSEKTLAVGSSDGTLAISSVENGSVLKLIDTVLSPDIELESRGVEAIAWSSSTLKILAVGNVAGEIQLYEVGTWKVRRTLKINDAVTKLEFVENSPILISSGMDGSLIKWDVRSGEQKWVGKGHNGGILGFAVQENGSRIITAGDEGVSLVFNAN